MATFAKPYTYKPTPPRSKSTVTRRKPAPKQVSIFDKLQHIKPNNAVLSMPRPAADNNRGDRPGIREMGTVYDGSGDDDNDLPTVEEILYTALRKEGFAPENRRPDNTAFGVGAEERGSSLDDNGSAPGDNSSGSPDGSQNPRIVIIAHESDLSVSGGRYIALSYCWGKSMPEEVKTKTTNIHTRSRVEGLPLLPRILSDAVSITRKLGIRYLGLMPYASYKTRRTTSR